MADKTYTYETIVDTSKGTQALERLRDAVRAVGNTKIELIDPASLNQGVISAQAATAQIVEAEKRVTIEARASASERAALARGESAVIAQEARAAAATQIEQERRVTAQLRAEISERERAAKAQSRASAPSGNGISSAIAGGIAAYFTVQGAKQIFNYATEIAALDTTVSRASKAFEIMAGSAGEAEKRLRAIQAASGGTVNDLQAMQIANQVTSLGLAKTSGEFEKLTRAARAVTFVSPVIRDVQSAITELALASANLSYRRLDQLGLSVTEVKNRMAELQSANSSLDDNQAFLAASVDALNSKFGTLLDSTEAQAGGFEKLSTSWSNFVQSVATSKLGDAINAALSDASDRIDRFNALLSGDVSQLGTKDKLKALVNDYQSRPDGSALKGNIPDLQRLIELQDQLNKLVDAGVPGLDAYNQRLTEMAGQAVQAGYVTAEVGAQMGYLQSSLANATSILDSTTQAGNYYAQAIAIAGQETVNTDSKTSALVSQMINLAAQEATGVINSSQYASQISILGGQLIAMASNAAIAANELANVNYQTAVFYQAANDKLYFGSGGTKGNRPIGPMTFPQVQSIATDTSINPFTVEAQQKSQGKYLDKLAKEREEEERKAASAAKRAAGTAQKLYDQANEKLQSTIAAIVKVSEVTQDDIDAAKNGTYKNKPDEYLRQLRDEVKNGKDYKDVSIEEAAAGLNKIGVETAGKSSEAILKMFEDAFSNMSLFSDASNLSFLNDAAVQEEIRLKELAKQGQENVFKHYGVVIDQAVQAAIGGGGGGSATGGIAAGVDASIVGSASGGTIDIKATITGFEFADGVEDSIKPKITFSSDSVVFTADDAAIVKTRLESQINPKLTFNNESIVFTADDAQIVRDRLRTQLTPQIWLSDEGVISADPKAIESFRDALGIALTPTIKPHMGELSEEEIKRFRQSIASAMQGIGSTEQGEDKSGSNAILGYSKKKKTENPFVKSYVDNIVAGFQNPETTLPLVGIGANIVSLIDGGIAFTLPTVDVGTEIIMAIREQTFTENNIIYIRGIGNNIYEFILSGIRLAMSKKNNNVGQEIVDNIAAQVIEATTTATAGAQN